MHQRDSGAGEGWKGMGFMPSILFTCTKQNTVIELVFVDVCKFRSVR